MYVNVALAASLATLATALPTAKIAKRDTPFEGAYTVSAVAPNTLFNGVEIQANGGNFYLTVGGGSPGTYCPTSVGSNCPPPTNQTVFLGNGLDTIVPGGQQVFTQQDGAISFTQAHSTYQPNYLEGAPGADSCGNYFGFAGEALSACPVDDYPNSFQVFANVASFNKTGCVGFRGVAAAYNGSTPAWQYE